MKQASRKHVFVCWLCLAEKWVITRTNNYSLIHLWAVLFNTFLNFNLLFSEIVKVEEGSSIFFTTRYWIITLCFYINHETFKLFVPTDLKYLGILIWLLLICQRFYSFAQVNKPLFIHCKLFMLHLRLHAPEELWIAFSVFICKLFLLLWKSVQIV